MIQLQLEVLDRAYAVYRLPPGSALPDGVWNGAFFSLTQTDEELSIVCDSTIPVAADRAEPGWSCLKVIGPLDFALTGILANLASLLAQEGVSIFAVSTYDTDYILVKADRLSQAVEALRRGGHTVL